MGWSVGALDLTVRPRHERSANWRDAAMCLEATTLQSVGAHRAMTCIEGEARRAMLARRRAPLPSYSAARGVELRGNAGVAIVPAFSVILASAYPRRFRAVFLVASR
jgi:hypothetical protein